MTREELIAHLEHLAEYVKYSEDAPALMEAIALLKTREKRTETHACDCISRRESTMGQVNDTAQSTKDCISRQAAIEALCAVCGKDCDKSEFVYNSPQDEQVILCPEHYCLCTLPPAQPDHIAEVGKMVNGDVVSRREVTQTILEFIVEYLGGAFDENLQKKLIERINALSSAQPEQRWIPCSERLPDHPENNDYYLVTIQCEHHDGWDDYVTGFAEWTKHGWDELSCYIGQIKVVAWMPLPEPYKEKVGRWLISQCRYRLICLKIGESKLLRD